jgi:hypothetical protein
MPEILDSHMRKALSRPKSIPGIEKIILEHGRPEFRPPGRRPAVDRVPIADGCEVSGIGIINAGIDEGKIFRKRRL